MRKNVIALALSAILAISVVGCSSNNENNKKLANNNSQIEVKDNEILPGKWSEDYTRDEVKEAYNKALASVKSTANGYSLEYEVAENEIKEENGESVNDTYIYLDIPDAERLESMYFGFKQYGSDLASGKLEMKMGYNLDKKTILEGQKFEFENLSLAGFSQAFTGDYERDYTELNKQIYDIIKNGTSDEIKTIENNIDGLKETITITDNFMLYKLESRVYNEEKLNKNNEVSLEEAEVYLAEAEVAEAKEFIRDEEIKTDGKLVYYTKVILSGVLDQIFVILLAMLVFGVFGLVIRVFGYQIANDGREELFLIMYIISNVLYYPIMQEVLHGKTLAKKFIFR